MSPRIVNKEEKKKLILTEALRVFARQGFRNTKVADIAVSAGIGKGTVYEYFKSKDQIFEEAIFFLMDHINAEVGKEIYLVTDTTQKLKKYITKTFSAYEMNADVIDVMFDYWAEVVRNKHTREFMIELYKKYKEYIKSILDEGVEKNDFSIEDTESLALIIISAMDGIMLQWMLEKEKFPLQNVVKALVDSLIEGIIKK